MGDCGAFYLVIVIWQKNREWLMDASSLSGFGLSSIATNRVSVILRFGFRAG